LSAESYPKPLPWHQLLAATQCRGYRQRLPANPPSQYSRSYNYFYRAENTIPSVKSSALPVVTSRPIGAKGFVCGKRKVTQQAAPLPQKQEVKIATPSKICSRGRESVIYSSELLERLANPAYCPPIARCGNSWNIAHF
jgi:hypothetical protein